jgi:hypothetical protein
MANPVFPENFCKLPQIPPGEKVFSGLVTHRVLPGKSNDLLTRKKSLLSRMQFFPDHRALTI